MTSLPSTLACLSGVVPVQILLRLVRPHGCNFSHIGDSISQSLRIFTASIKTVTIINLSRKGLPSAYRSTMVHHNQGRNSRQDPGGRSQSRIPCCSLVCSPKLGQPALLQHLVPPALRRLCSHWDGPFHINPLSIKCPQAVLVGFPFLKWLALVVSWHKTEQLLWKTACSPGVWPIFAVPSAMIPGPYVQ